MKAIGIDLGSSSIKGAVLNLQTEQIESTVSLPFPQPIPQLPARWIEIDPLAVTQQADLIVAQLLEQAPGATQLAVTSQMGGLILVDDRAQPLSNYLSWRNQRTTVSVDSTPSTFERVRAIWELSGTLVELGQELQSGSTTTLLSWLSTHQQLPKHAIPMTLGDYVVSRWLGHPSPMHATHAIGLVNLHQNRWHHDALELLGLTAQKLPELHLTEDSVGTTHDFARPLQLFEAFGDQQCALLGAGLEREDLSLNISTGSQVSRRVAAFSPGNYQGRKYFFGDYLDTVTHLPAGRSLNALVDLLTEIPRAQGVSLANPWLTIQSLTDSASETELAVDLAFFRGPLGDHGSIAGITTDNLMAGNLFRAAFRSMAENYVQIASRFAPAGWRRVVLSGGLTQSVLYLRTLLQQRFAAPLHESAGEETLLGLLKIIRESER